MTEAIDKIVHEWKCDARHEQDGSFYLAGVEATKVLDGRKCFVIGRKGTGKTALARYIKFSNTGSILLDFDRFRYQNFFDFKDGSYGNSSKYMSVWIYVIYMAALEVIYNNNSDDIPKNSILHEKFGDQTRNLSISIVKRILGYLPSIKLSASGYGVSTSFDPSAKHKNYVFEIDEINKILETTIRKATASRSDPVFVLVDDLDADINTKQLDKIEYKSLLSSLLSAVLNIKSQSLGLTPIVFMREDIYKSLPNPNRWNDMRIRLEWNSESIVRFIQNKIANLGICNTDRKFELEDVFSEGTIRIGSGTSKKRIEMLDHIIKNSQRRPRDVLTYLVMAAEYAQLVECTKINPDIIKEVQSGYSEYMADEIKAELEFIYDDVDVIFDAIRACHNNHFRYSELAMHLKSFMSCDEVKAVNVVHDLFNCGAIGNHVNGREIFVFTDPSASIQIDRSILIHRSLNKAFQM